MLTLALLINPSLMWVCTTYLRRLNKKIFLGIIWLWTVIVKKWFRLNFLKEKIFAVCHHNIIEFESEEEKLDPPMYVLLLFHKKNVLSKNYSHSHLYSVIKPRDRWVGGGLFWIFLKENRYVVFWDSAQIYIQTSLPDQVISWFNNGIQMTITFQS